MKNVSEYISTWDVFYGGNAAEQRTMTTTRHKQHKSGKLYPCYENKTRSQKLNLDNKCFQQL